MLRDVTLGTYYDKEGLLHSLDARVKLLFLLIFIFSLFYFSSFVTLFFSFCIISILLYLSRVPLSYLFRGQKKLIIFLFLVSIIIYFTEEDGLRRAIFSFSRMILTLLSSALLSATTRPSDIARGIEKTFGRGIFYKAMHNFSTIIMIAFRFIPLLSEEAGKIMDSQASRGADFTSSSPLKRAKATLPILVPLFCNAYHRADELALAMDSRGFGEGRTTKFYELKLKKRDYIFLLLIFFYFVTSFILEKKLWL